MIKNEKQSKKWLIVFLRFTNQTHANCSTCCTHLTLFKTSTHTTFQTVRRHGIHPTNSTFAWHPWVVFWCHHSISMSLFSLQTYKLGPIDDVQIHWGFLLPFHPFCCEGKRLWLCSLLNVVAFSWVTMAPSLSSISSSYWQNGSRVDCRWKFMQPESVGPARIMENTPPGYQRRSLFTLGY